MLCQRRHLDPFAPNPRPETFQVRAEAAMAYDPPTSDPTVPGSASSCTSLGVGSRKEVRPQELGALGGRLERVKE